MRKAQKKQAEELLELLSQAHEEIKKNIEKKDNQAAMNLLADCQDGAIALGELIEKTEGKEAVTVPLLEGYCELVYRIYEDAFHEQPVNAYKAYKELHQTLLGIEDSVKNHIKERLEIVFLPYKASMWDSLESVWKAADEDPNCDAYVIPIPYYDKNPDGSFGEMHYEADQYPKYVPVTWYGDYDFEQRRPDVVFIHNPYDECNYVTSVEPFFYSKNLKKYTEKLVYIPYFVLGEIDPRNKVAVEGITHFVTVPGVMNADRVIVQSEAMRQVYINVMTRFAGKHTRKVWEEKILGLGSPKFDKMENTQVKDEDIPKEWERILCRSDGSRKKVILYNTSVSALLQNNEKMLEKIRDVLGIFKENRDDAALLWRPHPLIQATISSMRPQLWREYENIVEEYRRAGWGIYDDTPELDRAIALSDGYYGDGSSVVELFRKMKKPIMLQNAQICSWCEKAHKLQE